MFIDLNCTQKLVSDVDGHICQIKKNKLLTGKGKFYKADRIPVCFCMLLVTACILIASHGPAISMAVTKTHTQEDA